MSESLFHPSQKAHDSMAAEKARREKREAKQAATRHEQEAQAKIRAQVERADILARRKAGLGFNNGETISYSSPWITLASSQADTTKEVQLHSVRTIKKKFLGIPFKTSLSCVQLYLRVRDNVTGDAGAYDYPVLFSAEGDNSPQIVAQYSETASRFYPGENGNGIIVKPGTRNWQEINGVLDLFEA